MKLDRRAVASMLLAVAGGLAVGLLGAREATATPLDCETDAVPFVYKGWYNDNGYVWFKNNSGKPVAVQVQGDQGPTPIAAGQVQSWPRKSGSQYQYWVYALSSGGQPVQPQSASGSAQTGVVYMINSPSSIGTPPLVPGSSDYSDLSSTLWAAFVGNDSGLSCESWVSSGQWIQDAQGYGGNALANAIAAFAGGQGGPAPGQYYYVQFQHSGKCIHQFGATMGNGDRITQWDCVNQPNVKLKLTSTGDGYYFLQFQHSGKCVQQYGASNGNGDPINQWDCQNWPNIKLKLVPTGDGYYFLQFQHSGKCVHQFGATMGNGDPITQWECVNQPNVKVKFVPAPS